MADFLRIAAVVREPLQVGDQDKLLVVMLQRDALAQRADVVAKMKLAGRAVAGEWFVDGSSGTPYQTVQPKDVLKTPKPPSGGFEHGNVYRAACYAGSHQRRG